MDMRPPDVWVDVGFASENDLPYSLVVDSQSFVQSLPGYSMMLYNGAEWLRPDKAGLVRVNMTFGQVNGTLGWGNYTEVTWEESAAALGRRGAGTGASPKRVSGRVTQFFVPYMHVSFSWAFPDGLNGCRIADDTKEPLVRFPVFASRDAMLGQGGLGSAVWHGTFSQSHYAVGLDADPPSVRPGLDRGDETERGPVVLQSAPIPPGSFEGGGLPGPALVLGPIDQPLSTVWAVVNASEGDASTTAWVTGTWGRVDTLPRGFNATVVAIPGYGAIRAMRHFGDVVAASTAAARGVPVASLAKTPDGFVDHLSIITDNGMVTNFGDFSPEKGAADVLVDVMTRLAAAGVPARHVQLDPWWTQNNAKGCVDAFAANETLLPGGVAAMAARMPLAPAVAAAAGRGAVANLTLYGACWAPDFTYFTGPDALPSAASWGGKYVNPAPGASRAFYDRLFAALRAKAPHGGYEVDFLLENMDLTPAFTSTVDGAARWFGGMGDAATAAGVPSQLCMAHPGEVAASVAYPAFTNGRASNDYACENGVSTPEPANWAIGGSSLLFWAYGLAPSKDGFWTTPHQPELAGGASQCGDVHDNPNVEMDALIATLSAGPVSLGDAPGRTNATLALMTTRADGVILKTDRPALAVDASWSPPAADGAPGPLPTAPRNGTCSVHPCPAALWHTTASAGPAAVAHSLFAANLGPWVPAPRRDFVPGLDAGAAYLWSEARTRAGAGCEAGADAVASGCIQGVVRVSSNGTTATGMPDVTSGRDKMEPGPWGPAFAYRHFTFWPRLANGWTLLGELTTKFVTTSPRRFAGAAADGKCLTVDVQVASGETVGVWAVTPGGALARADATKTGPVRFC